MELTSRASRQRPPNPRSRVHTLLAEVHRLLIRVPSSVYSGRSTKVAPPPPTSLLPPMLRLFRFGTRSRKPSDRWRFRRRTWQERPGRGRPLILSFPVRSQARSRHPHHRRRLLRRNRLHGRSLSASRPPSSVGRFMSARPKAKQRPSRPSYAPASRYRRCRAWK